MIKYIALFFSVWVLAISCRKGDLPEEHYFGKVNVTIMNLPNTPKVMMYFDGKQLDTILTTALGSRFVLQAGQQGKLAAFDAISHEFLADTLITIAPNAVQQFKFAYSPEFGLKGFVSAGGSSTVPKDSFDVRLFNNLSKAFYPKEVYDLSFIYLDPISGEILESDVTVKGWGRKQLSPVMRFKGVASDGSVYTYAAKLRDPATGEIVLQPDGSEFFVFTGSDLGGKSKITTIFDDNNGAISQNEIDL
ncbi:hypothetical protein ACTJJ0_11880 [Chitinophaga sp. 22321]|uniref:DUF4397 domain-containing protein n=1 Tax=Chitinophaga hostae TaxID=2831022 RepID=A0ABS5IWY8_9BACT|nr:hypothetical protein [Chitinophaga hostae]MBS0027306.1 hypothetical protein [Chitinophaga hostae]